MATNIMAGRHAAAPAFGGISDRVRAAIGRWRERNRLAAELNEMSARELADLGLSAADIPDVVRGTYRRG